MELLRSILRTIFGINADSFIESQQKEMDELLERHAIKKATYISDVESSKEAKLALIEELSLRIQEENETLNTLKGNK